MLEEDIPPHQIIVRFVSLVGQVNDDVVMPPMTADGRFRTAVFLKDYDPDCSNGGGGVDYTLNFLEAKKFSSIKEASAYCARPSKTNPLRADGKPNVPISAFSLNASVIMFKDGTNTPFVVNL